MKMKLLKIDGEFVIELNDSREKVSSVEKFIEGLMAWDVAIILITYASQMVRTIILCWTCISLEVISESVRKSL